MSQFRPIRIAGRLAPLRFKGGGDSSIDDTEDQKELAEIAFDTWQEYQTTYKPAEDQYIGKALNYDNANSQEQAGGQAAVAASNAFTDAVQQDVSAITGAGVNVNSGTVKSAIAGGFDAEAKARADNVNRSQQAVQDTGFEAMGNVVAMGQGKETSALAGKQDVAANSASAAYDNAMKQHESNQARTSALGNVAGMGYSIYKNSGDDGE